MSQDKKFVVELRLPGTIKQGEVVEAKLKIRHPSRTGLKVNEEAKSRGARFERGEPAVYIKLVEVTYLGEKAGTFEMNSSVSDDPIVGFKLRAVREGPITVAVTNYKGEKVEITEQLKFSA